MYTVGNMIFSDREDAEDYARSLIYKETITELPTTKEFIPTTGWLERDVERAAKRLDQWEKNHPMNKSMSKESFNDISKPEHYNKTGIEVIDVISTYATQYPTDLVYLLGNVFKYICRAPYKGKLKEDLEKARAYLTRAITTLEGEPKWK